jgi:hypothetical protein
VSIPTPAARDVALVAAATAALFIEGSTHAKGGISPAEGPLAASRAHVRVRANMKALDLEV